MTRRFLALTYPEDPSIDERIRAVAQGVVAAGLANEPSEVVKRSGRYFDELGERFYGLIMWGQNFIRAVKAFRALGKPVICLERGHFTDRFDRTRLGTGGIFGRAIMWAKPDERGPIPEPARHAGGNGLLVVGQPHTDNACLDVDVPTNLMTVIGHGQQTGYDVAYRPHPAQLRIESIQGIGRIVKGAPVDQGELADTLARCASVYTITSGVSVTAAQAGCRVAAAHPNGPLYGMVPKTLDGLRGYSYARVRERLAVLRACEFTVDELRDGSALRKMSTEVDIERAQLAQYT
jgi:hypothetical protein